MFGSATTTGAVTYAGGLAIGVGGRGDSARVLTIGDLTGSTAEGLIAVSVTASDISGALNITTRLPTGAQLSAQLTFGGDPFNGGITQFDFVGPSADDLRNLVNFDAADLMSILRQTMSWLDQLSDSSYLNIRLPFVDQTLGGLLDLGPISPSRSSIPSSTRVLISTARRMTFSSVSATAAPAPRASRGSGRGLPRCSASMSPICR